MSFSQFENKWDQVQAVGQTLKYAGWTLMHAGCNVWNMECMTFVDFMQKHESAGMERVDINGAQATCKGHAEWMWARCGMNMSMKALKRGGLRGWRRE